MSFFISLGFLFQVLFESFRQIDSRLVGYAKQDPQDISHFIGKIVFFAEFK